MQQLRELDGFNPVAGLTYHFHVRLHGKQYGSAPSDERLIFRDDDSNRRMGGSLTGRHEITLI
jgi:hypothetical protein